MPFHLRPRKTTGLLSLQSARSLDSPGLTKQPLHRSLHCSPRAGPHSLPLPLLAGEDTRPLLVDADIFTGGVLGLAPASGLRHTAVDGLSRLHPLCFSPGPWIQAQHRGSPREEQALCLQLLVLHLSGHRPDQAESSGATVPLGNPRLPRASEVHFLLAPLRCLLLELPQAAV